MKHQRESGYVALSGVLVVSAVTLAIVTTLALLSVSSAQTPVEDTKENASLVLVESCIEDVLLQIQKSDAISSPVTMPTGTCTATTDSHVGNDWTFTVSGTAGGYNKNIRVGVTRGTTITVTSWQEL